jgi:hypothetical protein
MQRHCAVCGRPFESKRPQGKYCGATCRQRARRAAPPIQPLSREDVPPTEAGTGLVSSVLFELTGAGREDSALGVLAVQLARRMEQFDTGGGHAALSRELRAVMAAALQQVSAAPDLVDDLQARRDAKRMTVWSNTNPKEK